MASAVTWIEEHSGVLLHGPTVAALLVACIARVAVADDCNANGVEDAIDIVPRFDLVGPSAVEVGVKPVTAMTADVDGDGSPDIVLLDHARDVVSVARFAADRRSTETTTNLDHFAADIALADFDGDGVTDLVTASPTPPRVTVRRGDRLGVFDTVSSTLLEIEPKFLTAGDFDGDGLVDVVVSAYFTTLTLLFGDGRGSFSRSAALELEIQPSSVLPIDVDADGDLDLLIGNSCCGARLVLLLNEGGARFSPAVGIDSSGLSGRVTADDIDGDGLIDLILSDGDLRIWTGLGGAAFDEPLRIALGLPARPFPATGDFDGNGAMDIALWDYFTQEVRLLRGPDVSQSRRERYWVGHSAEFFVSGDFDGDGLDDLAVGGRYETALSIVWGSHDGLLATRPVDVVSLPNDISLGDFDENGTIDAVVTIGGVGPDEFLEAGGEGGGASGKDGTDVALLVNDGVGGFRELGRTKVGVFPARVVSGRFDQDEHRDFVVWTESGENAVYLGDGRGAFTAGAPVPAIWMFKKPIVADWDFEGDLDLLAVSGNELVFLLNDGTSVFSDGPHLAFASRPIDFVSGQFDDRGRVDLAVLEESRLHVLLNESGLLFRELTTQDVGDRVVRLHRGDFDGDGLADLAVLSERPLRLEVLLNRRERPFVRVVTELAAAIAPEVGDNESLVDDFDGDGLADLLVVGSDARAWIHGGVGNGSLLPAVYAGAGYRARAELADVDGDRDVDIVGVNREQNSLVVLFNHSAASTSGDRDGDGTPDECQRNFRRGDSNADGSRDIADAMTTLHYLFTGEREVSCEKSADVDDDGRLTIADPIGWLSYLFLGTMTAPGPPYLLCGVDPTADSLACGDFDACH